MTDTRATTLPAGGDPEPAPDEVAARLETSSEAAARAGLTIASVGRRRGATALAGLVGVLLAAASIAAVLPSSWFAHKVNQRLGVEQGASYARTPASAEPVHDRIRIGDLGELAEQYPPAGDFYFVTVMAPEQSFLSWLVGKDEPSIEFLTREDVFGVQSPEQRRTFDLASMRTSEQVAQYVALKRLGYEVSIVPGEVLIRQMVCLDPLDAEGDDCITWSPSDEVLDPGDQIVEVDGTAVGTVDDLSRLLRGRDPGDVVSMEIVRDGAELDVEVELTSSPDEPDRTIVGFYPFDTAQVELPFELSIDTGTIGGPSAGLAFTLTLIDELSPGELTGGSDVAITGTIDLDGNVGPIGGLRQKTSAVKQAGVHTFIVPVSQGDDDIALAREVAGDDLEIVPVATLDEALAALARLGGDEIGPPPPPTTTPPGDPSTTTAP